MTTNAITDLYSGAEELLLFAFSSSSESFEPLARQVTDTVLSLPSFSERCWAAIATPCKIASSCYQIASGAYNGVKTYREICRIFSQAELQHNEEESERIAHTLRDKKLIVISNLCALLHIPNLLHEHPGSNPWSALHSFITRSISLGRDIHPSPSGAQLSPARQQFQLQTDAICTIATAVFLSLQLGYVSNENLVAKCIMFIGTISSSVQITLTARDLLLNLINQIPSFHFIPHT